MDHSAFAKNSFSLINMAPSGLPVCVCVCAMLQNPVTVFVRMVVMLSADIKLTQSNLYSIMVCKIQLARKLGYIKTKPFSPQGHHH